MLLKLKKKKGLSEKTTPFDTFAQIIDGEATIVISGTPHTLKTGESSEIFQTHEYNLNCPVCPYCANPVRAH